MQRIFKIRDGDTLKETDPIILESVKKALMKDDSDFSEHLLRHGSALYSAHSLYQSACTYPGEIKILLGSKYKTENPDFKLISEAPVTGKLNMSLLEIAAHTARNEGMTKVDSIFSIFPRKIPVQDRYAISALAMNIQNNCAYFPNINEPYDGPQLKSIVNVLNGLKGGINNVGFHEVLTKPWLEFLHKELEPYGVNLNQSRVVTFTGYPLAYIPQDQIGAETPELSTAFINHLQIQDVRRSIIQ